MGVKLFELLPSNVIDFESLSNKKVVVDGNLVLYQFLSSIRQRDGSLLTDSKGNITSHLTGLFNRTLKLMEKNIKLIYVFDGEAPKLKQKERERRATLKKEAELKYKEALKSKDIVGMKKYASRTTRLTPEMVKEAKELIMALGLPVIHAKSEGEAQAAFLVKKEEAYALATQDADAFMFGSPRIIKNLTITGRKKMHNKLSYQIVKPELIKLDDVFNTLGIDQKQLIALGMLVGTDFNQGGVPGIGPKNALKLVKKHGSDLNSLFEEVKWSSYFEYPWKEVYDLFDKMAVFENYDLEFKSINIKRVKEILVEKHEFNEERVNSSLEKLSKKTESKKQKGLKEWF